MDKILFGLLLVIFSAGAQAQYACFERKINWEEGLFPQKDNRISQMPGTIVTFYLEESNKKAINTFIVGENKEAILSISVSNKPCQMDVGAYCKKVGIKNDENKKDINKGEKGSDKGSKEEAPEIKNSTTFSEISPSACTSLNLQKKIYLNVRVDRDVSCKKDGCLYKVFWK